MSTQTIEEEVREIYRNGKHQWTASGVFREGDFIENLAAFVRSKLTDTLDRIEEAAEAEKAYIADAEGKSHTTIIRLCIRPSLIRAIRNELGEPITVSKEL